MDMTIDDFLNNLPTKSGARYFVAKEETPQVKYGGFTSKSDANNWITQLGYDVWWRVGFYFRLKSLQSNFLIVDKNGNLVNH